jgi:hypothetical protein
MEYWMRIGSLPVLEPNSYRVSIHDVVVLPTLQHSGSAVVAIGYYGEVGYSSTP